MKDKISRTVIENRSSTYAMISRVAVDRDKLPDPIRGGFLPRLDDDDDDDDVARKNYAICTASSAGRYVRSNVNRFPLLREPHYRRILIPNVRSTFIHYVLALENRVYLVCRTR